MQGARAGHLAMLAFSLLVAGSFALGARTANDISPLAFNVVRFWIGVVIMGIAVRMTVGIKPADFKAIWRYPVLAGFFTLYFVLMFEGLKTAPPVSAAAVFTLTPILAAGFGWLLLRQRLTGRMAIALLIGGLGAIWVIFRADLGALTQFKVGKGEFIYFWGCVSHAVYTPLVRKLNRGESPIVFSFGVMLAGAILLTVIGWDVMWATDWNNLPKLVWITILYTAVFASAATFTLLQFATLRLPSSKVMAYTYLTPSWVILWDISLGGTAPPVLVIAGISLTCIALYLLLKD